MLRQTQQIGVPLVVNESERRSRSSIEAAVYIIFETAPLEHPHLCEPLRDLIYKPLAKGKSERAPRPLHEWNLDKVEVELRVLASGLDEVANAAEMALEKLFQFRY